MYSTRTLLSTALFITSFFQLGNSLVCYECNSRNNSQCALEKPPDSLKKDCSTHQNEAHKYVLCRKIIQSIEYEVNGLQPDTRIIRSCGWDGSSYLNSCYQRSGFGGRQEVCTCQTDLCNSSTSIHSSLAILFAGITFLFINALAL